jgi:hypothetical protein
MIIKEVNLRSGFKNILFKVGLLSVVLRRRVLFAPKKPQEQEYYQRFFHFRQQYGKILRHGQLSADHERKGKVLICGGNYPGVEPELVLIKSLELSGYTPVVLIFRNTTINQLSLNVQYYWWIVKHILFLDDFCDPLDLPTAETVINRCGSIKELLTFTYEGIRVGRFAISTTLRLLRIGWVDLYKSEYYNALIKNLASSMLIAKAAQKVIRTVRPQMLLFVDGVYTPDAEVVDVCLANGMKAISWDIAHKSNSLMVKRYQDAPREHERASISDRSWQFLLNMDWTAEKHLQLQRELDDSYARGDWYIDAGTQFNKQFLDAPSIIREIGLDINKKTAFIFPHILWDASLMWGIDLFSDYEEWLRETIQVALRNYHVNWVIKIHPANIGKSLQDGYSGEPAEMIALKSILKNLPPHVFFIPAESPISTNSLFSVMDYCVTVRGTVGIEAARLGIPVLTAGTGRYDRKGFTIDSNTREEFLEKIAHIQDIPPLSKSQQELAERFAYGLFILRPLSLKTITLESFDRKTFTSKYRLNIKTKEDWLSAPDLLAFSQWLTSSTDSDYLALH